MTMKKLRETITGHEAAMREALKMIELGWERPFYKFPCKRPEDLIRARRRSPDQKIDRIAEIVEQLRRTPQGSEIIPEDFDALWNMIHEARETLK